MAKKTDPRVTKRKVTMTSVMATGRTVDGKPEVATHEAVDYVRPDFLREYIDAAKTKWQHVTSYDEAMASEPDAGPGGYEGTTHVPAVLAHPLSGQTFAAEES